MSDLAVSWVAVASSAWRRRLRCAALALAAAVLTASALVLVSGSGLITGCASVCVALVVMRAGSARRPEPDGREWSIGTDGRISVRRGERICRDAAVVFASAVLIVLCADRRNLEIWRDATPLRAFRRLSVAARWRAQRGASQLLTGINRADASERT